MAVALSLARCRHSLAKHEVSRQQDARTEELFTLLSSTFHLGSEILKSNYLYT